VPYHPRMPEALAQVWAAVDTKRRGYLTRAEFGPAMTAISLAQTGVEYSAAELPQLGCLVDPPMMKGLDSDVLGMTRARTVSSPQQLNAPAVAQIAASAARPRTGSVMEDRSGASISAAGGGDAVRRLHASRAFQGGDHSEASSSSLGPQSASANGSQPNGRGPAHVEAKPNGHHSPAPRHHGSFSGIPPVYGGGSSVNTPPTSTSDRANGGRSLSTSTSYTSVTTPPSAKSTNSFSSSSSVYQTPSPNPTKQPQMPLHRSPSFGSVKEDTEIDGMVQDMAHLHPEAARDTAALLSSMLSPAVSTRASSAKRSGSLPSAEPLPPARPSASTVPAAVVPSGGSGVREVISNEPGNGVLGRIRALEKQQADGGLSHSRVGGGGGSDKLGGFLAGLKATKADVSSSAVKNGWA
ncbi:hypothetical protein CYMTET_50760, partial [Cymbomonas tetramitiformis]